MRWGITEQMSSVEICMDELKKCNETSCGPSFVVFYSILDC